MSRTNMFKQMEKVGSTPGAAGVPRQLNPNSIKDALLRWVQNRINDYPVGVYFDRLWNAFWKL